jgi:DNA-binding protein HU-beta
MTKDQFCTNLANKAEITKKVAQEVYDATFGKSGVIAEELVTGREVVLGTLGKFKLSQTAARVGRNPLNGEPVQISAKKVVRYSPSSTIKASVNGK